MWRSLSCLDFLLNTAMSLPGWVAPWPLFCEAQMSDYVPIEYPKWVNGQIVESAEAEAALTAPPKRPTLTLNPPPDPSPPLDPSAG